MQWMGGRRSTNIEDRRGMRPVMVGGGLGAVILTLIALYFGVDPGVIVNSSNPVADSSNAPVDDTARDFVATVLGYTEDTWSDVFRQAGRTYTPPKLVLFSGAVESACGLGQSAMGPFYCPSDQKVYLDMSFFRDLRNRFQAPGDFAEAYVIAHEVGHHVQNLLGTSRQVEAFQRRASKADANRASVALELQADCLAGVWANRTEKSQQAQMHEWLESGDIDEALNAASAVGDDRLQMQTKGYVIPESFTHGSAAERSRWFRTGMDNGSVSACNTFQ
jgi:predicted metalloprotease